MNGLATQSLIKGGQGGFLEGANSLVPCYLVAALPRCGLCGLCEIYIIWLRLCRVVISSLLGSFGGCCDFGEICDHKKELGDVGK